MRKYWDEAAVYSQPSTSLLKRNAKESMDKFIDVAIANRIETMLQNAEKPSERIMDNTEDVSRLFGVV